MRNFILLLCALLIAPLLLLAAVGDYTGTVSRVSYALPKDINGANLHDEALGLPYFSEAVTLSSSTATSLVTLPTSGHNASRQWRKIMVRNPSSAKYLYLCFGSASACETASTANIKVSTSTTVVLDGMYFGPMNTITTIWGWLDSSGANVIPEVTVW